MPNFVNKPVLIKANSSANRDFSLCPSDYRDFMYDYEGVFLIDLLDKKKTGQEIGSNAYIKNAKYKFLKTRNINFNYLVDKEFTESCGNANAVKPFPNSIFIAKDGGGAGLGDVGFYDINQYDGNDFISSGILNIVPKKENLFYVLAILKYVHFKNFIDTYTKKGSTIRHSKKLALEYKVPYSDSISNQITEISDLMKKIVNNEITIRNQTTKINQIINNELNLSNYTTTKAKNTISSLKSNNCRMDSGMYSDSFAQMEECLKKYNHGCFTLPIDEIKSGNTPKERFISEKSKYVWVTPTDIQTNGLLNYTSNITMNGSNNINNDCLLIINRGDKYDVGISMFYDHSYFKNGHHNQGIYRVDCYDKQTLISMSAYLNSTFCRKLCSYLSYGTKMREMKSVDFSKLLFPKFPSEIQKQIFELYTSEDGILTLGNENIELKIKINALLDSLYNKALSKENNK